MNKKLLLSVTASAALIFAGCKQSPSANNTTPTATATPATPEEMSVDEIKKLSEATKAGKPIKCTTLHKTTGDRSESIISASDFKMSIKSEIVSTKQITRVLSDGKTIYNWDEATKKGTKIAISDPEEMKKQAAEMTKEFEQDPNFTDPEKIKATQAASDTIVNCDVTSVTDADFTPPTDVEFQDMGAMIEQSKKMMENSQQGMTEEQKKELDEMMKKYSNQ